ncbi:hypothetical protein PG993_008647 [Apiospora rasikravindrae]|uniref:Uncharacterized protein n=1 Tax=Apiospora rasikravindrae TaxID=990691 RepID=A0ABR1SSH8_9PEZI
MDGPLKAKEALAPFRRTHPSVAVEVHHTTAANKRLQIDSVLDKLRTFITFLVDSKERKKCLGIATY